MTQEDKNLLSRLKKGEDTAFNELVKTYQQQIYQLAKRILGTHHEAEDLTQEVFIKVHHKIREFRGDASLFTWIYRIAVNLALNAQRKRRFKQLVSLDVIGFSIASKRAAPDQETERNETLRLVRAAIDKLPEKQKIVFTLRHDQGLPHTEIAKIMNREEGTVRANYHQALRKLRKAVKS
ncbi:sigma-70 family RNA polymerase sigma factor [bacterium]|nr:sigma-70 family RNA polymerase sigma factor [bacterium]MBU1651400.1 sigma-70 family RNA polymerase sigma factor [bacterium]